MSDLHPIVKRALVETVVNAEPKQKSAFVPFSPADACWCQPFDGPQHPNCPMHGSSVTTILLPEEY